MQVMFEVSTLEMWPDFMYDAINAPSKKDEAPVSWNSPQIAILFISYIFITSFFILNMFISVIISQY
jgi:hypothetical protein